MKLNPLALLPGTLFWVAVVVSVVTRNSVVIAITVVLGVGTFVGFAVVAVTKGTAARKRKRQVWATGTATTATVVASRTNGSLNNDPYVQLTLQVGDRTVEVRQLVSQIMLSKVQPGEQITVKIDPADPATVVVDQALVPSPY